MRASVLVVLAGLVCPGLVTMTVCGCGGDDDSGAGPAPTAGFTVFPTTGTVDTLFQFDATQSRGATATAPLQVRWDWESDGIFDTPFSSSRVILHKYDTPGIKAVTMEVRDSAGRTATAGQALSVTAVGAPTARMSVTPQQGGDVDTVFQFDASESTNAQGTTTGLEFRWDWEGDGIFDTSFSAARTASHRYPTPGSWTATLEVRDVGGRTAQTARTVTVSPRNTPPVASFVVVPATGGDVDTNFQFDASGSTDDQDPTAALQVRWDWESDGVFDTPFSTVKTMTHTFAAAGTWSVTVEVKDTGGRTSTFTRAVTVGPRNSPPQARFVITPASGDIDTVFTFDASGSTDEEDLTSALVVRWDWNADGIYDTDFTTTKVATHQFTTPGTKTVQLEVRDTGGKSGTASQTFTVHPNVGDVDFIIN